MPEPIYQPGPVPTPYVYTVTGTGTVTPLACQAVYNGSGAGGDFVPAVIYRSQDGNVIARAILDSTVTAGDDAEVSWFPGVTHAGSGAVAAGSVFARAYRDSLGGAGDPVQTVNTGLTRNGSFPHTFTSDSSVIDWTTSVLLNDTAELNKVGTYIVWATTHWSTPSALLTTLIMDPSQSGFPHLPDMPTGNPAVQDAIGSAQSQDYNTLHVAVPTASIHVAHGNATAFNADVQQCYFSILYVPTT